MPDINKHLQIANHNYEVLSHLSKPNPSNYTDWCVTLIFYMALHLVQAYLAEKKNNHPTDHPTIQKIIQEDTNLKSIYMLYRHFQDDSVDARYNGIMLPIYKMRNDTLKYFKKIRDKISDLLNLQDLKKYDLYPLFPLN